MKITHEDYKEDLQNLKKSYIVEMSIKDLEDYLGDMTRDYKHFTEEEDRVVYLEGFIENLVDNFGRKKFPVKEFVSTDTMIEEKPEEGIFDPEEWKRMFYEYKKRLDNED